MSDRQVPDRLGALSLRLVRKPLGNYVRPFPRDFNHTARMVAEAHKIGTGVIIDPRDLSRSADLRKLAREEGLEVILDPLSVELSTEGGFGRGGMAELPWAAGRPHRVEDFSAIVIASFCRTLARMAVDTGSKAVLIPTHHLDSLPNRWLGVDHEIALELRGALDAAGGRDIMMYYPLVVRLQVIQSAALREYLIGRLSQTVAARAVDAVWLRVPGFGVTHSGPVNLRRYFQLARATHALNVPIVAERTGTLGLALLAFGVVGGVEQGITFGEGYDLTRLTKPASGRGFLPAPRVYVPELGIQLSRDLARELLSNRTLRNRLGCQRACCRHGADDMLGDPRRHFLVSRASEIAELSQVPPALRADHYLETWLRPASDRATHAARIVPRLLSQRERLDQWRTTLSDLRVRDRLEEPSRSPVPTGIRIERRGA